MVCMIEGVLSLVRSSESVVFVWAKQQHGGRNETLQPTDPRILYEPLGPELFTTVKTSLGMDFVRVMDPGSVLGVRRVSLTVIRGTDCIPGCLAITELVVD